MSNEQPSNEELHAKLSSQTTQTEAEPAAVTEEKQKMTDNQSTSKTTESTVVVKKTSSALGLLALLIALGVGGAGYYFGQQQVENIQQKLTALEGNEKAEQAPVLNLEQERAQIAQLLQQVNESKAKFTQLEQNAAQNQQLIASLQQQIQQLSSQSKAVQPNEWLLSEADFLLNNALRKLVLDNDIDTSVMLLKLADEVLAKVSDSEVAPVRSAINGDLKRLLSVNNVDQNAVMQRLSQLANGVDELAVLNVNFDSPTTHQDQLSDSLGDWQENAKKSAVSFFNHFIKIQPRQSADAKVLLAPNQDIYLRENIRLRLQIAILAVPRQQDDLYKQSLETVASWIRTYFDTNSDVAQSYLKNLDELAEQSIYINAPDQLTSLVALDRLLERQPQEVQKIEIEADKSLTQAEKTPTENTAPVEQKVVEPEPAAPKTVEPQQ